MPRRAPGPRTMLEKPDLPDEKLISCLSDNYGLQISQITFLPLGNDRNTAVYRVVADDGTPYFLKLRGGLFEEATVTIPRLLSDRGIAQIIPPIPTSNGHLWTRMAAFAVILYPYVAGRNGYETPLSEHQWAKLGLALKSLHAMVVPEAFKEQIPRETYAAYWRDLVRGFQVRAEEAAFPEPVAARLTAFLRSKHGVISDLIWRAERLAGVLRVRSLEYVLCHADIHAWNVLIDANDALYIVDWDTLILAPKERDLMFVGGGVGGIWNSTREEALFYRGYGQTAIDPMALAYYRYERIVEDIAAFCEEILLADDGGNDREKELRSLISQFLPNDVVEIAYASDRSGLIN